MSDSIRTGVLIITYLVIGYLIAFSNWNAFILYATILPIHSIMLAWAFRNKYYTLTIFTTLAFVSFGINSFLFFLHQKEYPAIGFNAIGDFRFNLLHYFQIYSYILIYTTVICLSFKFAHLHPTINTFSYIKDYIQSKNKEITKDIHAELWIFIVTIAMSIITIIMYYNQIGIVGLQQKRLPFHLTGILYFTRQIVFSAILVYLYWRSKNKLFPIICIIIYSFLTGIAGASRSLASIILVPIIAERIFQKKYLHAVFVFIIWGYIFIFISTARGYIFEYTDVTLEYIHIISTTISELPQSEFFKENPLVYFIWGLSDRTYGGQTLVLADQYYSANFSHLLSFYKGASIEEIIPDIAYTLFGIKLPPDMAYGVSVGFPGIIILLSCHNYFYTIIQALIFSFCYISIEKILNNIIKSEKFSPTIKFVFILFSAGILLETWIGETFIYTYLYVFILLIINIRLRMN